MAKLYGLTAADRKLLRDDHRRLAGGGGSQRPVPRRRRGPRGGGGAGAALLIAKIGSNINAATKTSTGVAPAVGAATSATILEWDEAATSYTLKPKQKEEGGDETYAAMNLSLTSFTANSAQPLYVVGYLTSAKKQGTDPEPVFVISHPLDMRSIPGFDASKSLLPGFAAGTAAQLDTVGNWLKRLEMYVAGVLQSIGHDADGMPKWQDDSNECP